MGFGNNVCFFNGFLCPGAGVQVRSYVARPKKIHGNHGKLGGGAALQKKYFEIVGNPEKFPNQIHCLISDSHELFAAVTQFNESDTFIVEVDDIFCSLSKYFLGQSSRPWTEVIYPFWHIFLLIK